MVEARAGTPESPNPQSTAVFFGHPAALLQTPAAHRRSIRETPASASASTFCSLIYAVDASFRDWSVAMSAYLNENAADGFCACGLPLHYTDPIVQAFVEGVIRERGPNVIATIGGRAVEVPRHFIALHGLDNLDPEAMGFPFVAAPTTRRLRSALP
jgi:hypothetical protein